MGILRYFWNVVSGKFAHWNTTNNEVITEFYQRFDQLDPKSKMIVTEFITSSSVIVDYLFSPSKSKEERIFGISLKKLDKNDFEKIHTIILESMTGVFHKLNPSLSLNLTKSLKIITESEPQESDVLKFIIEQEEVDLSTVSSEVLSQIKASILIDLESKALDFYPFTVLYGSNCKESFEAIKKQLKN